MSTIHFLPNDVTLELATSFLDSNIKGYKNGDHIIHIGNFGIGKRSIQQEWGDIKNLIKFCDKNNIHLWINRGASDMPFIWNACSNRELPLNTYKTGLIQYELELSDDYDELSYDEQDALFNELSNKYEHILIEIKNFVDNRKNNKVIFPKPYCSYKIGNEFVMFNGGGVYPVSDAQLKELSTTYVRFKNIVSDIESVFDEEYFFNTNTEDIDRPDFADFDNFTDYVKSAKLFDMMHALKTTTMIVSQVMTVEELIKNHPQANKLCKIESENFSKIISHAFTNYKLKHIITPAIFKK